MATLKTNTIDRGLNKIPKSNTMSKKKDKVEKAGIMFYLLVVFTAFFIMAAVFGGAFFIIIRKNVNGLGEKFRKDLQDVPVLKLALPEAPDPLDEKYMSEADVRKNYTKIRNDMEKLQEELAGAQKKLTALEEIEQTAANNKADADKALKEAENQKALLQAEEKKLETERNKLNEMAALSDKSGFKTYYEQMDSAAAEKIYREIIKEEKISEEVRSFVQIYENMDASKAAKILEQFGTQKIDLVVEIIKNMKKSAASEILASMNPSYSAQVTQKLSTYYLTQK